MSITKEDKDRLKTEYGQGKDDTGSPQVQIAVLTHRIKALTEHLREKKKDHASRRGLLGLVSRRRRLLDYLKRTAPDQYVDMITRLGLRK